MSIIVIIILPHFFSFQHSGSAHSKHPAVVKHDLAIIFKLNYAIDIYYKTVMTANEKITAQPFKYVFHGAAFPLTVVG